MYLCDSWNVSTLASECHLFSSKVRQPTSWPGSAHYRGFTITLMKTTLGRTPLDKWSARRRDLYVTIHNTHKKQTSMTPVGFEDTIPESEWLHTKYVSDHAKFKPVFFVLEKLTGWFERIMTSRGADDFLQTTSDDKEKNIEIVIKCHIMCIYNLNTPSVWNVLLILIIVINVALCKKRECSSSIKVSIQSEVDLP